jgi:hypothetical protein
MSEGRFSNGFILGLIIGGGLVFLIGTKTGKKLLKTLSEEGVEGITNLLEEADFEGYDEEIPEEVVEEKIVPSHNEHIEVEVKKPEEETKKSSKKRFFKKPSN